jgi:RND family efflux transporter MFP subunit
MSSRRNQILVVALPVGAILLAVLLVRMRPEPPRSPPPDRIPVVTTAAVTPGGHALPVVGNGTVVPRSEVELAPQVGGRVEWVSPSLQSGGQFTAGELLVRIEEADFVNAVQQARAQVAQDSVGVLQAEEEARIARDEYERFRTRAGSSAAQPSPLVLREPQLQAARAALARSTAQLADAELALERTGIRAPFTGRVRSENVDPGSFAAPGQALARIYASDMVEVVVSLSDADASVIPGLWALGSGSPRVPARVIASYGARRYAWEGYVDRAPAALDERSRTIDVVVRVPDPFRPGTPTGGPESSGEDPPPLLVGQFVEVHIQGRGGDFHVIPRRALQPGNEVWAVADSTVRLVSVRVLQQAGDSVFVAGDLRPGERVIVAGISLATEGLRVRPSTPRQTGEAAPAAGPPGAQSTGAPSTGVPSTGTPAPSDGAGA